VTASERRAAVAQVTAAHGFSERRALRFTGFPRATVRYRTRRPEQALLREKIKAHAEDRPRWGYRRIHVLLTREGWKVNRKRVHRLYRLEGLAVRRKGKRRRSQSPRPLREELTGPNQRWCLDFMSDTLASGRTFRCLNIVDEFNRECLAIDVAHSIPSVRVIEVLEQLREERGLPAVLISDNGSEFTSRAFDAWAYARGVKHDFIQPGKPIQNAFIESFNGSFRDECLNLHWFKSLADARRVIESWREDYNQVRPHSSLGGLTPQAWSEQHIGCDASLATPVGRTVNK
jgi:putative transposase